MRANGRDTRALWWEDGAIRFIDQRLLPHAFEVGTARSVADAVRVIADMGVRGAPAIGVFAAYALALAARACEPLDAAAASLLATRPTAVNLRRGLDAARATGPDPDAVLAAAKSYDDTEVAAAEAIGRHGLALIREGTRVLTHCNAGWLAVQDWGTALAPVYRAHRAGLAPSVLVSETRPRLQGARLTAWELGQEGVAHTLVADTAVPHLIQRGAIDLVITGADRIAADGDTANKIGTYGRAVVARRHAVPFYVAAPLTTFDRATATGDDIPIEERDPDEVLRIEGLDERGALARVRVAPAGTHALNPAFDVTPHELIAGFITEVGIVPATAEGVREAFQRAEGTSGR